MSENSVDIHSVRKYIAELVGTFALVFFGVGSAVFAGKVLVVDVGGSVNLGIGYLGIALTFGLILLVMCYAIGPISGCHVNPAVTLGMRLAGRINNIDTVFYVLAQCIGAILAAGTLLTILMGLPGGWNVASMGLGQNGYGSASPSGFDLTSVFMAEVILTFFFLLVILSTTHENTPGPNKGFAGVAIGLTLAAIHLVSIPIDGTSVNPARSLGPAVFVGGTALSQVWVFWVAPIIGGLIAALVHLYVLKTPEMDKLKA